MKKLILDLALTPWGSANRISAIKQMRTATGLGLKDAKDVVDSLYNTPFASRKVIMKAEDLAVLVLTGTNDCFTYSNVELYAQGSTLDLTQGSFNQTSSFT